MSFPCTQVWVVDEDVVFPSVPYVAHFIRVALESGALIAQPSIVKAHWHFLRPHPTCRYLRKKPLIVGQNPM